MHDIKKIRENPSDLDELLAKRKHPPVSNQIIELDEKLINNSTIPTISNTRRH